MMRISLLGELDVVYHGGVRRITAPKQRAVLAHLALDPGVAMSADRLLDLVWGDNLPAGRAKAVAFQVTKLRDALDPDRDGTGDLIRTTSSGYVLDIDPDAVDIHRAASLIADAQSVVDDDPAKAADLAEDAIRLWRGTPFADVADSLLIDEERGRIDLLEVNARIVHFEARLALDDAAAVVTDIARLAERHPLDEAIASLHLRALSASGRTAEALRACSTLRARLVDELGIDPSPEIARLELRLLERQPTNRIAPVPTRDSGGVPLPAPVTSLVGRDDEADAVVDQLGRSDCRVLTLTGPGGIGKTRLAIEAGHRWRRRHDGAVWYCPLAGVAPDTPLVDVVAATVGFVVDAHAVWTGLDEVTQLVDALGVVDGLVVFDNAEHLPALAPLVADIAIRCPNVTVLVTSREPLAVAAEWCRPVAGLPTTGSDSAAARLFLARAAQAGATLDATDRAQVDRVCEVTDGLPLAIELGAALAPVLAVADIADRLQTNAASIEAASSDVEIRHRSLHATFDSSWEVIDDGLRTALARLAVFPAPFDHAAAQSVAGAGASTLGRLTAKSLVRRIDRTHFDLHPMIRQCALTRIGDADAPTRNEHAAHYLGRLVARTGDLVGSPSQHASAAAVDDEIDHIRAALRWRARGVADRAVDDEIAAAVYALAAYGLIRSWVIWSDQLTGVADAIEQAVGLERAVESSAYVWARLLHLYPDTMLQGDAVERRLEQLEAHVVPLGNRALAWLLTNRAVCREMAGDSEHALELMQQATELVPEPDLLLDVVMASWHGWELSMLGRHHDADRVWRQALDRATAASSRTGRAFLLSKVGIAAEDLGQYELALRCHEQSIDIFEETGDRGGLGYTLSRISSTQRILGRLDDARRTATEGLDAFRSVNHRWGIGASYGRRGHAALDAGDVVAAATDFAACVEWGDQKKLPSIVWYGLAGLGLVFTEVGWYEDAVAVLTHNTEVPGNPYVSTMVEPALEACAGLLTDESYAVAAERGRGLDLELAIATALLRARDLVEARAS